MEEEVITSKEQKEEDISKESKKEIRHRKKRLLRQLMEQMEFYLSSANISKDRFTASLMESSPYIDLEVFFKYNRIRSLTEDIKLLQKAVNKSSVLELSEDGLKVKRKTAVVIKHNELQCTIYVENLPSHVDHDWIRHLFAQYGVIDYISLPRFRRSCRPKGFAFVEFQTPEMANLALEAFGALEHKIPTDMDPAQLQSIRTYECSMEMDVVEDQLSNFSKDAKDIENISSENVSIKDECEGAEKDEDKVRKGKNKRKNSDDCSSDLAESKKKRETKEIEAEIDDDDNDNGEKNVEDKKKKDEKDIVEKVSKRKRSSEVSGKSDEDEGASDDVKSDGVSQPKKMKLNSDDAKEEVLQTDTPEHSAVEQEETAVASKKRKKKKRKRCKKIKEKEQEVESIYVRVMSKEDWKRLRNKYLNAQRENMNTLKTLMRERRSFPDVRYSKYGNTNITKIPKMDNQITQTISGVEGHRIQNRTPKSQTSKPPEFIPNVVIKISFEEPPQDAKKLRETIREGGGKDVAYVDISRTEKDVYVRFLSEDGASAYKRMGSWSRMEILSDSEEQDYWNHILACWSSGIGQRNKHQNGRVGQDQSRQMRGREKLLQKAFKEAQNSRPNTRIIFEN